jgi:hypothetical protein
MDMQNQIIYLLSLNTTATSLEKAAFAVNALSQVNHKLHALLNNPKLCLQIIKYLATKFNCSDQAAAEALQTQEAKRRLKLQNDLYQLCIQESLINLSSFESLLEQGVDLEFTYQLFVPNDFPTPLMLACTMKTGILEKLLSVNTQLFDINRRNYAGQTALMLATQAGIINNIKILLDAGADPEITDNFGLTILQAAQQTGNQKIIDLIQNGINKKSKE